MKIEDYKEMSNNVQVPDRVLEAYENALEEIRGNLVKTERRHTGWQHFSILSKVAIIFGVLLIVSGGTFLSVKAYISHLEKLENMSNEEIIDLYETIDKQDGYAAFVVENEYQNELEAFFAVVVV